MARRRELKPNHALQKQPPASPEKAEKPQDGSEAAPIDAEILPVVPPPRPLINAQIIQILIEKDNPDEIERLMRLELDYNKERFQIMREHSQLHPEAIESRQTRKFRRTQYIALIGLLFLLVAAMPFVAFPVAATFALICVLIVAALCLNGREREVDLGGFVKVLTAIMRRDDHEL
jgi:hypothetical protein